MASNDDGDAPPTQKDVMATHLIGWRAYNKLSSLSNLKPRLCGGSPLRSLSVFAVLPEPIDFPNGDRRVPQCRLVFLGSFQGWVIDGIFHHLGLQFFCQVVLLVRRIR